MVRGWACATQLAVTSRGVDDSWRTATSTSAVATAEPLKQHRVYRKQPLAGVSVRFGNAVRKLDERPGV